MDVKRFVIATFLVFAMLGCRELAQKTEVDGVVSSEVALSVMPVGAYFGTASDIDYANKLWQALIAGKIVGSEARPHEPFFGGAKPHGLILEVIHLIVLVGDHSGFVIVKKNYDGPGASVETVKQDRVRYLDSITVMYRREAGYDNDNQNWFWVKYRPDGTLFAKTLEGQTISLAGRLMKGETPRENRGCIYCHSSAGGGDYVFYPDILVP